ncbi:helix-turn-helix transcriptional regulator [Candidatus Tisiphia endosymbiont of Beris chalybata]|uniref:helix-turn-helix domain-containing protein n=1 Tax=Candidatus Tisiphia endosymbiont of Beris chalybata TaxID=3066262 RepID=UPI00312C7287
MVLIIAKRLKERREMLGMSQKELSKAVKINEKQVQKYENAVIPVAGGTLYFLAKELKVPPEYFLDVPHIKPPNEYFFTTEDDYKFLQYIIAEESADYVAPPKEDSPAGAAPISTRKEREKDAALPRSTSLKEENLTLDSLSQLTAEVEEAIKKDMCYALQQEIVALVKAFVEVPNPIIRQKIIELLKAITVAPLDPD